MDFGTINWDELLQPGERLRKVREMKGLTREQLVELVELLPENDGKTRSAKQIDYIERGVRPMSPNYARLLAKALKVRVEFLLCEDDYPTLWDMGYSVSQRGVDQIGEIETLLVGHGYVLELLDATEQPEIEAEEPPLCCPSCGVEIETRKPPNYCPNCGIKLSQEQLTAKKIEKRFCLTSPAGKRKFFNADELAAFLGQIDDLIEMFTAFQFQERPAVCGIFDRSDIHSASRFILSVADDSLDAQKIQDFIDGKI